MRFTLSTIVFAVALVVAPAVASPMPELEGPSACSALGDLCTGIGALPCCIALRCQVDEIVNLGVSVCSCVHASHSLIYGYFAHLCSSASNLEIINVLQRFLGCVRHTSSFLGEYWRGL